MVRGLDLRDLFTGDMSWRRLQVLVSRLPSESETKTAIRDATDLSTLPPPEPGRHGVWSQTDMLLARIGDSMNHWLWMNGDPKSRPAKPPAPFPRPGVDNVRPISQRALQYLEYKRQHHGADPPEGWEPETG